MLYFWIRRQVRKVMQPIPFKKADTWSRNLTAAYVFTAWCACGIMIYNYKTYQDKLRNSDPTFALREKMPGNYYGRILQAENMHMYTIQGGKIEHAGTFQLDKDELHKNSNLDFYGEEREEEE